MKKTVFALLALPFIFVAIAGVLINRSSVTIIDSPDTAEVDDSKPQVEAPPETSTYTLSEVAQHKSKEDCWTVIDDYVYDLTEFINRHPGGDLILQACGVDATEAFKNQGAPKEYADKLREENPEFPSEFHSPEARQLLEELRIGEISG